MSRPFAKLQESTWVQEVDLRLDRRLLSTISHIFTFVFGKDGASQDPFHHFVQPRRCQCFRSWQAFCNPKDQVRIRSVDLALMPF
jgi:hypothetical protein